MNKNFEKASSDKKGRASPSSDTLVFLTNHIAIIVDTHRTHKARLTSNALPYQATT